jgi:hypothetical protein
MAALARDLQALGDLLEEARDGQVRVTIHRKLMMRYARPTWDDLMVG